MKYTVRYAHLDSPAPWRHGEIIRRGDVVGRMGNSGQSTAAHLHIDVVRGEQNHLYKLKDIGPVLTPDFPQLLYFIDSEMFGGVVPYITTCIYDISYYQKRGKYHPAIDCVPIDRHKTDEHFTIYYNRSKIGRVTKVGYEPGGYGHYIMVVYDV